MTKNYTIHSEDIVTVAIKDVNSHARQAGLNVPLAFFNPINFKLRELAILNKDKTKCILVREINSPHVLDTNKINLIPDIGYNNLYCKPASEWITLNYLQELNNFLITRQIYTYLNSFQAISSSPRTRTPPSRRDEYQELFKQ